jgi:hypothetical protein
MFPKESFVKNTTLAISLLLSANSAMAVVTSYRQSSITQKTSQLTGTIVDMNLSRVSGVIVTIEGEGMPRTVTTSEDGSYKIDLPIGIYRIKATRPGFCPAHRAPFRALISAHMILNLTLIPCAIINEITIKNDQYVGEKDGYKDPFKEEVFPLAHPSGAPLELLVRYGSRQSVQSLVEYGGVAVPYEAYAETPTGSVRREKYQGVTATYDALTIRADRVRLDPKTFRLEAEGNVLIEDGKRCAQATRVVAYLKRDEPLVELIQ